MTAQNGFSPFASFSMIPTTKLVSRSGAWVLAFAGLLAGCGATPPTTPAETTPATPAIPEEFQDAARALLGSDAEVLVYGDLAKTGKQQVLAVNRPPKPPNGLAPGGIITRAVIAEKGDDGKWSELLRCDEHLKNPKGFLGLTPRESVSGWRLQYEQSADKGLQLYFTPLQLASSSHPLTVGVRWNPLTKRYQSLDREYQNFLVEVPALENPMSQLR